MNFFYYTVKVLDRVRKFEQLWGLRHLESATVTGGGHLVKLGLCSSQYFKNDHIYGLTT